MYWKEKVTESEGIIRQHKNVFIQCTIENKKSNYIDMELRNYIVRSPDKNQTLKKKKQIIFFTYITITLDYFNFHFIKQIKVRSCTLALYVCF